MKALSTEVLIPREIRIAYKRPLFSSMIRIENSFAACQAIAVLVDEDQLDYKECFWVLLMTTANRLIGVSMIAQGTEKAVMVSFKEVVQLAITSNASAVIVIHNHPSGNLEFSQADHRMTSALTDCLRPFDISLLDHIVITSESHTSMADEGLLPE